MRPRTCSAKARRSKGGIINPLRLTASNFGPYPSLNYIFLDGVTAILGPNGSGKSTLLRGIELSLFADGARDLAPALGPFAERMELELVFEHDGETYRVRRGYGKKTTLDLEQLTQALGAEGWEKRTLETTSATQQRLEDLLGLSRATFNASAFLAQGNSAAFPEASPAERKALLGAILDPRQLWPRWAERARTEARTVEAAIAGASAQITDRELIAEQVPDLYRALDIAKIAQQQADANHVLAAAALEVAQNALANNAAVAERYRSAQDALAAAEREASQARATLQMAQAEAGQLDGAREKLGLLDMRAAQVAELETKVEDQRTAERVLETALSALRELQYIIRGQKTHVGDLSARHDAAHLALGAASAKKLELETVADTRCDRCGQELHAEARATALLSLLAETERLRTQTIGLNAEWLQAQDELTALLAKETTSQMPPLLEGDFSTALAQARQAAEERAALTVRIEVYEAAQAQLTGLLRVSAAADTQRDERAAEILRLQAECRDNAELEQAVSSARAAFQTRRIVLNEASAQVVRAEEALARAREAQDEAKTLRTSLVTSHDQLDTLRLAERACGRDGVPALLAETVVPVIEAEANRVLERLPTASGTVFRVDLRTQRALKSSVAIKETLDILVSDRQTTREFLTFSGGERFRVSFALRWALAKLLAGRRGAESRLLVIDEPDGLDAGGMDGLAAILAEPSSFERVLLVSHNPLLASAFEQVVVVESDGVVSRISSEAEVLA